jgi:hypothetical protein
MPMDNIAHHMEEAFLQTKSPTVMFKNGGQKFS